ncbi:MAG: DsrE family protein [Beijerinckiaceae bacterium]|nr:DsrE family protein [Beijerinckiaceae bacterium]
MMQTGNRIFAAASLAVVAAIAIILAQARISHSSPAEAEPQVPQTQPYQPQKVVYHISSGGGWFKHDHIQRLQNMENHLAALPAGDLSLAVVLQGNGVDLLVDAASDKALASRVSALRDRGVKFLICRNTLVSRHIGIDKLSGARAEDVVGAGVAEVTRLQSMGYAYLRL